MREGENKRVKKKMKRTKQDDKMTSSQAQIGTECKQGTMDDWIICQGRERSLVEGMRT